MEKGTIFSFLIGAGAGFLASKFMPSLSGCCMGRLGENAWPNLSRNRFDRDQTAGAIMASLAGVRGRVSGSRFGNPVAGDTVPPSWSADPAFLYYTDRGPEFLYDQHWDFPRTSQRGPH